MDSYAKPLENLIKEFMKLPSVGPKSAQRMAFHFIRKPYTDIERFSNTLLALKDIRECSICCNYSQYEICPICSNQQRDHDLVCVVADFRDLAAIENSGGYTGTYHVLGGLISPMDGISPEDLSINKLLNRISSVKEVILATNPTVPGETTALYILRQIRAFSDVKISRIAYGLPVGANLEYADGITILRAIEGRKEL